ncbi:MAG: FAD-binding oxidoreductase [Myxococcota bacterium]|nr:FAD-binding oxidoreductase [Myxococcota bacterium]
MVFRPERETQIQEIVSGAPTHSVLARGMGRSYGDAALNQDAGIILHERFDHFLAFDDKAGILTCEAGVTLSDIIDVVVPRGFFLPVTPGTQYISIGGAIAADVHGKNHHLDGTISSQLIDFRIITGDGQILTCSRNENSDLFWATLGGLGLTGCILQARLQLRPVESAWMTQQSLRCRDLDTLLQKTFEEDDLFQYSVAWVDCLARGRSLGRSILLRANPASTKELPPKIKEDPYRLPQPYRPTVPFNFPSLALNNFNMRIFNQLFWMNHRDHQSPKPLREYFYPLDRIHQWNRVYGRPGVSQYQFVLPLESCPKGIQDILETVSESRGASFLAVLKKTGPANEAPLSFPIEGASMALDFPNRKSDLKPLLERLDRIVVQYGGRVYLAKDSSLGAWALPEMYPALNQFRDVQRKYDPNKRFSSSLARRLELLGSA